MATKPQAGIVKFRLSEIPNLSTKVWDKVGLIGGFTWDVPENWKKVENIIGKTECDKVVNIQNSTIRNREIRKLISPYLKNGDTQQKKELADWVIYNWGKITKGRESSADWTTLFEDYRLEKIVEFVNGKKNDRIASWSKVLAFADMETYAVYDAWTALALNSILDEIGYVNRFYMPPPRAEELPIIAKKMREYMTEKFKGTRKKYMGYFDYMELLHAIVKETNAIDVLDAEMHIFANGERLCRQYANKHNIAY